MKNFVYEQPGNIILRDENNKDIDHIHFNNYGEMVDFINKAMRKQVMADLKATGQWE